MKNLIIFVTLIVLVMAVGCAGKPQFRSNVHSGDVPEWVVPASLSPAFEKDGKIIAVGLAGRMYNGNKQKEDAALIAISKIRNKYNADSVITNIYTDNEGNIFVVAEQRQ